MGKKVLVVDDEADVRKFLTTVLEKHGYETITAEDGTKALLVAAKEKPRPRHPGPPNAPRNGYGIL